MIVCYGLQMSEIKMMMVMMMMMNRPVFTILLYCCAAEIILPIEGHNRAKRHCWWPLLIENEFLQRYKCGSVGQYNTIILRHTCTMPRGCARPV